MADTTFRMFELAQQGLKCSQILLQLGLELQGKDNPDLIRASSGLAGGLGFTGRICGALTGGVCLLSLYAADNPRLYLMIDELVAWFEQQHPSINCYDIIGDDPKQKQDIAKCGAIVALTFDKVKEILEQQDISLTGDGND
ncbi:C-GCAxxG-C-C family protein [Peptococcaceae bacterium 1198_IL3148]